VEREACEADVVTMSYRGLPSYEEIVPGLRVHRVRCWRSRKEICRPHELLSYIIPAFLKCRSLLRRNRYDVCHTHFLIPTGIVALLLKKLYRLDYVVTSHGSDVPGYNQDRFTLLHRFTRPLLKAVAQGADTIVVPSNYLGGLIKNNIDAGLGGKIVYIPNGIDSGGFVPGTKQKIILSTGRLLPRKGFQHLIRAVSRRDLGYELHICGDGPMMSELRHLALASKTEVVFHGWLDNAGNEYRRLLETAAIYCLVSSRENASVALLEAMSAGCAVITSNASGCTETIGDAGVTVEFGNTAQITEALELLTGDASRIASFGNMARRRAEDEFDWDKNIGQYAHVFRSIKD
jgi:glycosyltransferase involved in cell wall biosynthesis